MKRECWAYRTPSVTFVFTVMLHSEQTTTYRDTSSFIRVWSTTIHFYWCIALKQRVWIFFVLLWAPMFCFIFYCRWKAFSVQPMWHAVHSEIPSAETREDPYRWVVNRWSILSATLVLIKLFFVLLGRWEAFPLWRVWNEIYPEVSHGETQKDSQWREAIPVWLLPPGTSHCSQLVWANV